MDALKRAKEEAVSRAKELANVNMNSIWNSGSKVLRLVFVFYECIKRSTSIQMILSFLSLFCQYFRLGSLHSLYLRLDSIAGSLLRFNTSIIVQTFAINFS